MSWTDSKSIEVVRLLRDKYKIQQYVETGTFMGINAELHKNNFDEVTTVEVNPEFYERAKERLSNSQVELVLMDSANYLRQFREEYNRSSRIDNVFFYLDAHFYDANLPEKEGKFVVLKELEALAGFDRGILMIHDFHNGLGGVTYDGIPLDMDLLRTRLNRVNPDFVYYTNKLESTHIVKPTIHDIKRAGLPIDEQVISNLEYAWSTPRLTFRGILYAVPSELSKEETDKHGLKRIH